MAASQLRLTWICRLNINARWAQDLKILTVRWQKFHFSSQMLSLLLSNQKGSWRMSATKSGFWIAPKTTRTIARQSGNFLRSIGIRCVDFEPGNVEYISGGLAWNAQLQVQHNPRPPLAFMPGRIHRTNEVLIHLGYNWFVENDCERFKQEAIKKTCWAICRKIKSSYKNGSWKESIRINPA